MAVMSYLRTVAPEGQSPSGRAAASTVGPSQGAPEWPFGENGGRCPRWGLSSGQAYLAFFGSKRSCGLLPLSGGDAAWPGTGVAEQKLAQQRVSSASPT